MAYNFGSVGGVTDWSNPQSRLRRNLSRWPGTTAGTVGVVAAAPNPNPGPAALQRGLNILRGGPAGGGMDYTKRYTDPANYPLSADNLYGNGSGRYGGGYGRGGGTGFEGDTAGGGLGQHQPIQGYSGSGVPTTKPDGTASTADDFYAHLANLDWQKSHPQGQGQQGPGQAQSFDHGSGPAAGGTEQDAANQEQQSEVALENSLGGSGLEHLFKGGTVAGKVKAVVGDDPNNPWAEPEVVESKSPIKVINHAQALADYGPGLNEPGAPPHFFAGGTARGNEEAFMPDGGGANSPWADEEAWNEADQQSDAEMDKGGDDDDAAKAFTESEPEEPVSTPAARVSTPVPAAALNRWQRAAVDSVNDFYANNPEAVAQRGAEAQAAKLASEGITTLNSPTGPVRLLNNRYGTGIFAAGGLPAGTPHYVGDEKGAVNTDALDNKLSTLHYQQDPLAGTDWGTRSGIAPKPLTDAELDAAITGASHNALADYDVADPDQGKLPVAQQMAAWQSDHPAQTFDDSDGGETQGPAPFHGPLSPEFQRTFGVTPQPVAGNPYARSSSMPGMTGDPRVDRNLMRYYRTPQGAANLSEHALATQKMEHENELWEARSQHSDDRADKRNQTAMDRQALMDANHQQREHDFLQAKYGQQAKGAGVPVPFEHQWSDGTTTTGFAKPDGTVEIVPRGKADPEVKIHNVPMPNPSDPSKTVNVPHFMKFDAQGNPYLVKVPQGAPSATATPAALFAKKK